jgi:hypothetical protein
LAAGALTSSRSKIDSRSPASSAGAFTAVVAGALTGVGALTGATGTLTVVGGTALTATGTTGAGLGTTGAGAGGGLTAGAGAGAAGAGAGASAAAPRMFCAVKAVSVSPAPWAEMLPERTRCSIPF